MAIAGQPYASTRQRHLVDERRRWQFAELDAIATDRMATLLLTLLRMRHPPECRVNSAQTLERPVLSSRLRPPPIASSIAHSRCCHPSISRSDSKWTAKDADDSRNISIVIRLTLIPFENWTKRRENKLESVTRPISQECDEREVSKNLRTCPQNAAARSICSHNSSKLIFKC